MKTPPETRTPARTPEPIDALLTRWATSDREPPVAEHEAILAAERALAKARTAAIPEPANDRRWLPAALVGGGMAAAIAGVMFIGGQTPFPVSSPNGTTQIAAAPEADADDILLAEAPVAPFGAPQRAVSGSTRLAELNAELEASGFDFDEPNDDLFMVGHVFTPRPEEEMFLP